MQLRGGCSSKVYLSNLLKFGAFYFSGLFSATRIAEKLFVYSRIQKREAVMNYGKAVKVWSAGLIFSVATAVASAGPIATMDLDFQNNEKNGFPEGYRNGTINYGNKSADVSAGMFRFSVNNFVNTSGNAPLNISSASVLDAFCIDIHTSLAYGSTGYSLVTADQYFKNSPAGTSDRVGQLYSRAYGSVSGSQTSAAFQLALWEIVTETEDNTGPFLGNGFFDASDNFGGAKSTAEIWLTNLDSYVSGFDLFVLSSATDENGKKLSQDLLVVSPTPPVKVPEPGTLALLALGIFALVLRKASGRAKD